MINLAVARPSNLRQTNRNSPNNISKKSPFSQRVVERLAHKTEEAPEYLDAQTSGQKGPSSMETGKKVVEESPRSGGLLPDVNVPLPPYRNKRTKGRFDLYYFDESALRLIHDSLRLARAKERHQLPARRYGRINVLGFMNRHNDLHTYMFEQSIHTGVVIACFDAFCQTITKKTVVVVGQCIHPQEPKNLKDRIPHWKKHGLIIQYLPPYSPELNLIEILWRRIKYTWLPFSAYACLNALSEALETILSQVGSEYQITFALGTYVVSALVRRPLLLSIR